MDLTHKFDIILLAAQRVGIVNPLAQEQGVSHKCMVRVSGQPLIERMLEILSAHPGCRAIHISIEADGEQQIAETAAKFARPGLPISFIRSSENIAQSVLDACGVASPPYVITTADNILLSHQSIDHLRAEIANGAKGAIALASEDAVKSIHPMAQRRFYRLKDGGYANCNLYALSGEDSLRGVEFFRSGGQFMKNKGRMLKAIGLSNIILMALRLVGIHGAMRRLSRQFGLDIRPVILGDGTQAIDVDNKRTYKIVEAVLEGRAK